MRITELSTKIAIVLALSFPGSVLAQAGGDAAPGEPPAEQTEAPDDESTVEEAPDEEDSEGHDSAEEGAVESDPAGEDAYGPALPEGMSLDDVLDIAAQPPPEDFPRTIPDDRLYVFLLGEQFEYRAEDVDGSGHAGLELQAWAGGDFDKVWLKTEAEGAFVGETEVEAENDLLYSRLITPFWNLQAGVQYAFGWAEQTYDDRWSGALALQGMAPGMFEIDASMYLSEALDLTAALSAEYDIRLTQRLVLQPHAEFGFSAQTVDERGLGPGLTDMNLDARLRYEITRKFAPYLGVRYRLLTFGTAEFARDAGESPGTFFVLGGVRFAI